MDQSIIARLTASLADRYRIDRELGQGGMATVYLAEDLKHRRKVALKVLKPELAAVLGAERFVQEITTTASLQHPNILPLFDSGTADGFLYYVMPFIDGETLRTKLDRETQFGIEEAVRITMDVADALDYAHRNGVIHRDIKPENILVHNGRPMVADFGIALALSAAAGGRMTETGLSLGTPHYMSPEQATAEKEITARSDVYSLGSVLYEMLTGNPPHVGASAQQIIMKIIVEPVQPVAQLRKSVPPNVAAAVAKSLEKLPADRFESARAFAEALKNPGFTLSTMTGDAAATAGARRSARAVIPLAVAALLLLVAAAWGWMRPAPVSAPTKLDLSLGAVTPNEFDDVVISPDGSMLAVAGTMNGERAIYLRQLGGDPDFQKVAGTETGLMPSFSPDNRWLVLRRQRDNSLVKVAVAGGGAITLVGTGEIAPYDAHWGTTDQIIFSGPQGAHRITASGGAPERMPKVSGRRPFLLPDGSGVLHGQGGGVSVFDFKSDSSTLLIPNGRHPVYVETGHLLYIAAGGGLFAVSFDLGRHRVTGDPVRVLDRVASSNARRGYAVSSNGVLVHHEGEDAGGGVGTHNRLVIMTFGGSTDTVRLPAGRRLGPRFSPDGRSIAFEVEVQNRNPDTDIHTFDLVTGTNTQITFAGDNDDPIWSPDGKRIIFNKDVGRSGEDLFIKPADNGGPEQSVLTLPGQQVPTAWLNADTILFMSNAAGQPDLFIYSLTGGGKPRAYLEAPWVEDQAQVSPDGTLAVFVSTEAGGQRSDTWLRDFPVAQGKWRVSSTGGVAPRWSPDGQFIYFWRGGAPADSLYRARVERTPAVVVRAPELLLTLDVQGLTNWDLHPDGKRFIVAVPDAPPPVARSGATGAAAVPASRYLVVLNWFTELEALMSRAKK